MSSDVNPSTGLPYVPLPVLQAALWAASDIQTRVSSYRQDGTVGAPTLQAGKQFSLAHPPRTPGGIPARLVHTSNNNSINNPASSSAVPKIDVGLTCTTSTIAEEIESLTRTMSPRRSGRAGSPSPRILSGRQSPAFASPGRQGGGGGGGSSSSGGGGGHFANPLFSITSAGTSGSGGTGPFVSPMDKFYWPVPVDGTMRLGDAVSANTSFNPSCPFPDLGPQSSHAPAVAAAAGDEKHATTMHTSESGLKQREPSTDDKYFGFGSTRKTGAEIYHLYKDPLAMSIHVKDDTLWSRYEPFRFAVEFWGVDQLGEKERAYSTTQFHAGSYFNIYVQMVKPKHKGIQLGIYLHRQSMLEPLPAPSQPHHGRADHGRSRSMTHWTSSTSPSASAANNNNHSLPPGHSMVRHPENRLAMYRTMSVTPTETHALARSVSPLGVIGSDDERLDTEEPSGSPRPRALSRGDHNGNTSHSPNAPASPYRDSRKQAKVWFSVSCASAMGTALTRFGSGPDLFTVSQSWGWKSSALRSQEYLSTSVADQGGVAAAAAAGPSTSERLSDGVLGWVSETMDEATFKKKDLKSLRATVCMGVM